MHRPRRSQRLDDHRNPNDVGFELADHVARHSNAKVGFACFREVACSGCGPTTRPSAAWDARRANAALSWDRASRDAVTQRRSRSLGIRGDAQRSLGKGLKILTKTHSSLDTRPGLVQYDRAWMNNSPRNARLRLRPGKKGLELRLHELEATVMDVIWGKGLQSFAVSDVLAVLEKRREIAYTTVMTTVARLHSKGLLSRERDGRRYLYSPKLNRDQFLETTAREVIDGAVGQRGAIAMLAERVSEASSKELDDLEALIRRRRQELKR